jgi:hypothetical protein
MSGENMFEPNPRHIHDLDDVRRFPLEDDDLIIAGFPRSGTNWIQVIVANLWDDWSTTQNEHKRVPNISGASVGDAESSEEDFLQGYEGYASCIAVGSPRLMKCHLPPELMPARWPEHGKVLHISRNPKDVCVSYFHMTQTASALGHSAAVRAELEEYVDKFVAGEVPYGPYLDHMLEWYRVDSPNLLRVTYEGVKADTLGFVKQLAEFLDKPVSSARAEEIVSKSEFNNMRNNELTDQINVPHVFRDRANQFMRKGVVGGWKSELTVHMSELIDEAIVARLAENGIVFGS